MSTQITTLTPFGVVVSGICICTYLVFTFFFFVYVHINICYPPVHLVDLSDLLWILCALSWHPHLFIYIFYLPPFYPITTITLYSILYTNPIYYYTYIYKSYIVLKGASQVIFYERLICAAAAGVHHFRGTTNALLINIMLYIATAQESLRWSLLRE